MKVPLAFRSLYDGRGGIMVAGVTIVALVLSAVALGLLGLGVTVFLILLIAFIELWREVVRYEAQLSTLDAAAQAGTAAATQVKDLERQASELKAKNRELLRQASSPSSSHEGLLAAISVHLSVLGLVEKHRAMREDAPDAPLTQAEMANGGNIKVIANCPGPPEVLVGESVVIIESRSGDPASAISTVEGSNGSDVYAHFDERGLPTDLVENLRRLDRVIPDGYSLRLAGLIKDFDGISDEALRSLVAALEEARGAIHVVLKATGREPGLGQTAEEIKELEGD